MQTAVETRPQPAFEIAVRRVLRVPPGPRRATADQAHRLFSASIALSALRCTLSYVVLPIIAPLVGTTATSSAAVGIPVSILALVFDVRAIRRFWLADHPWRWRMTVLYVVVIALVLALLGIDLARAAS